jgi:hypothetical protein
MSVVAQIPFPGRFRAAVTELGYPIGDLGREGFVRRDERRALD